MCSSLYQRLNSSSCSAGTSQYTMSRPSPFFASMYSLLRAVACCDRALSPWRVCHTLPHVNKVAAGVSEHEHMTVEPGRKPGLSVLPMQSTTATLRLIHAPRVLHARGIVYSIRP